jgi:L-threonylcarbamoyladenylate synthase
MAQPAIFLDRDGTLMEDLGHLGDPAKAVLYPETIPALRSLGDQFLLFIVTNQNGVAKGVTRLEDVCSVNEHIVRTLEASGVNIREVYCCPHQRSDGCECIKPNPHFGRLAERDHGVDLASSFVVGDHPADVEFAANLGARGIYVLSGHGEKHLKELTVPSAVVSDIAAAVEEIVVERAVAVLRAGGLVAFPTETVYGLGADAEREESVRRIFKAKGRPTTHPLIVHAADPWAWTEPPPDAAIRLAGRFWPGPLTIILKRSGRVSDAVTGGQGTVGVRMPSHPLALAMLRRFGGGVAAPSANRFGKVSPTSAQHVRDDLGSDVDFILDGGACDVGVESTIVDLSGNEPAILRPGGVTREAIEETLGRRVPVREKSGVRSPGQLESHYAPRAEVVVAKSDDIDRRVAELRKRGLKVEVLARPEARNLYALLRDADARGADVIVVAEPSEAGIGLAVGDRLRKASGPRR